MIVQIVRFESSLTEAEVLAVAKERLPQFQALPGLVQKYYVKLPEPNQYGGIYIWDSAEALQSYRGSELAASIPSAYQVVGSPRIEVLEGIFPLRE